MARLTIDVRIGDSIQIGEATVTASHKSGQLVRLVIEADKDVPVKKLGASPSMQVIAERGFAPSPV